MIESSEFSESQPYQVAHEKLEVEGSTCDAYRVKIYGKLHFMKRLKPEFASDVRYREALRKEFETGYNLEHPHIVKYFSFEDESILMEYVDGHSLTQALTENPTFFKKKKNTDRILMQLLDAVKYLHNHQVLHLDLKPDNILITKIGHNVKLVDLGCCKTDVFADTQGYTDKYAAPEQKVAKGEIDEQTDIYAIGKIIEEFPNHHIYNKVISRCTANDKSQRYHSVDELLRDIRGNSKVAFVVSGITTLIIVCFVWGYFSITMQKNQQHPISLSADTIMVSDTITQPSVVKPDTIPHPSRVIPKPVSQEEQMRQELSKIVEKAYDAYLKTFCDSIFPPIEPSPTAGQYWEAATTAFNHQVMTAAEVLSAKYPQVPRSLIDAEASGQVQDHIASVFNRMRNNRELN